MLFGVCAGPQQIPQIKAAGYDFVELPLYPLSCMSDEEFAKVRCLVEENDLPSRVVNLFFGGDAPILREDSTKIVRDYIEAALARAAALGCKIAVIGSGTARRRPDDMPVEVFFDRFATTVRTAIEAADTFGITIVIEPICRKETNTINTISDAIAFTDSIGDERLKLHADTYHMFANGESLDRLAQTKGRLAHLHIARANVDRGVPCEEDVAFLGELGDTLAACNYDGYVSIEATYKDFENEIIASRPLLQKLAR